MKYFSFLFFNKMSIKRKMVDSAEKHIDEWSTVIKPQKSLLDVDFKEIWKYRDLWSLFVKRDIVCCLLAYLKENTQLYIFWVQISKITDNQVN